MYLDAPIYIRGVQCTYTVYLTVRAWCVCCADTDPIFVQQSDDPLDFTICSCAADCTAF